MEKIPETSAAGDQFFMLGGMGTADEVVRILDDSRGAMRELLLSLVALPTENPPATGNRACVERLEAALAAAGIAFERIDVPSPAGAPRAAILAVPEGAGPTLWFHGHYDVVPAQDPAQFEPRADGDTIFGRGTSDMKSGLVAMLFAVRALRQAGHRGRAALAFVPDEETGGRYGSAALAEMGVLGRDGIGMLLPEPTSGAAWHASRGAITIEVSVGGRAAHVGLAHQGINAFERAVAIVNRLIELKGRTPSILLIGGRVEAGTNFNVVPAACRFTVDRRTDPDEDFEEERRRLFAVFEEARAHGIDVDVEVIQEGRSSASSPDTGVARALARSVEEVCGKPPAFELCPGLLETRFYAARGIPAYAYGPGVLAVSHGPHEFVKVSRMVECAKVYALTAMKLGAVRT
jgi:acetylornithine deacetylase/succinyl-diaminopimelate desuccinylase-like protein